MFGCSGHDQERGISEGIMYYLGPFPENVKYSESSHGKLQHIGTLTSKNSLDWPIHLDLKQTPVKNRDGEHLGLLSVNH